MPDTNDMLARVGAMVFSVFARLKASRWWLAVLLALIVVSAASIFVGTRLKGRTNPSAVRERVRVDGSLTVDPRPMTLEDVRAARPGSASEAVLQLWFWVQWGSAPNIADSYLPAIVRNLGADQIAGAYSLQRGSLVATKPRLLSELQGGRGTVVTLEALRRNSAPQPYSFTFRKVKGTWRIVFDTLLEQSIAAYAQYRETPSDAKVPPPKAVRAGLTAAENYRAYALQASRTAGEVQLQQRLVRKAARAKRDAAAARSTPTATPTPNQPR